MNAFTNADRLSTREWQVIGLAAKGLANKTIARELNVKSKHQRKEQLIGKLPTFVRRFGRMFDRQESREAHAQKPAGVGRGVR